MPLFDYRCLDCGNISEILITKSNDKPRCSHCGGPNLEKRLSAHASISGTRLAKMPRPGDTGCCGVRVDQANCEGPGSCCGKFHEKRVE